MPCRDHVLVAPSGVQKERLQPEHIFVCDMQGDVVQCPTDSSLKLSQVCGALT